MLRKPFVVLRRVLLCGQSPLLFDYTGCKRIFFRKLRIYPSLVVPEPERFKAMRQLVPLPVEERNR